jgi:NADH-quinone oxidoreductase subunit C
MTDALKETIDILQDRYEAGEPRIRRPGLVFVTLPGGRAVEAVTWMRDRAGFTNLVMISCVDRIEDGLFELVYLLNDPVEMTDIGICVEIGRDEAVMESMHHLWAGVRVYQRELREMYGIDFPGSPGVDEPMILEGWDDIPPMRRDFDTLEYAERTYYPREGRSTRDPATEMAERSYPLDAEVKRGIRDLARSGYGEGKSARNEEEER